MAEQKKQGGPDAIRARHEAGERLGASFGAAVVLPAAISALVGVVIFAGKCLVWLTSATWPASTIHDGINYLAGRPISLSTGLLGLDKIVSTIVYLPLEVGLVFILPLVWILCGIMIFNFIGKKMQVW